MPKRYVGRTVLGNSVGIISKDNFGLKQFSLYPGQYLNHMLPKKKKNGS